MGESYKQFLKCLQYQLSVGLLLFFLVQCTPSTTPEAQPRKNEIREEKTPSLTPIQKPISYHLISTKDSSQWLSSLKVGDTLTALLVLNRIDRASLLRLDTLVVPDTIGNGIDLYAPFPKQMDTLRSVHKILFISYYTQTFAVYESGKLIRWGPASLGKESSPTPTGLLSTNWKSKKTTSTINSSWVMKWYFNLANFRGVSMHEYALPGYPASHACVRLYKDDAYWLYHWADQWILKDSEIEVYGTPVVIFGTFPFGQRKPWLLLAEDNLALEITLSELTEVTSEFLPVIFERQAKRDSLVVNE